MQTDSAKVAAKRTSSGLDFPSRFLLIYAATEGSEKAEVFIRIAGMLALSALFGTAFAQDPEETLVPVEKIPWEVEAPGQPQRLGKLLG